MSKVEIYSDGTNIFGYELFYEGGYQVGHHIGSMLTPAVKCHTLQLDKGDFINSVLVYTENLVDRIVLYTNNGREFAVGGDIKPEHKVNDAQMKKAHKLIAFRGGFGGHLHNIQCIYI